MAFVRQVPAILDLVEAVIGRTNCLSDSFVILLIDSTTMIVWLQLPMVCLCLNQK